MGCVGTSESRYRREGVPYGFDKLVLVILQMSLPKLLYTRMRPRYKDGGWEEMDRKMDKVNKEEPARQNWSQDSYNRLPSCVILTAQYLHYPPHLQFTLLPVRQRFQNRLLERLRLCRAGPAVLDLPIAPDEPLFKIPLDGLDAENTRLLILEPLEERRSIVPVHLDLLHLFVSAPLLTVSAGMPVVSRSPVRQACTVADIRLGRKPRSLTSRSSECLHLFLAPVRRIDCTGSRGSQSHRRASP